MDNYRDVIKTARRLQSDFGKEISLFEALQIAAQMQVAEVVKKALTITNEDKPEPLEAIAIALGTGRHTASVAESLNRIAEKENSN